MREILRNEGPARSVAASFGPAALVGLLLVLPLIILELVNRRNFNEGFPVPLFGFLWLLPAAFVVVLVPLVRAARAGNSITANPISLLFRLTTLALIAVFWGGLLIDQLPCFLGVPNCD